MTARILCQCAGNLLGRGAQCPGEATQEDFLCDHCRTLDCPNLTREQVWDSALCLRRGCPEHSVPGGRPLNIPVPF